MEKLTKIEDLERMATTLRRDVIEMLVEAGSGHTGGPLDLADIAAMKYTIDNLENVLMDRKIDILINNAGIALKGKRQLSPQGYELTYAVNVNDL